MAPFWLFWINVITVVIVDGSGKIAIVSLEDQKKHIESALVKCVGKIEQENLLNLSTNHTDAYCQTDWDEIMCWPRTPAGATATQPCPSYINGFYIKNNATKYCTKNGTWFVNPQYNHTWTNLTSCNSAMSGNVYDIPEVIAAHMGRLVLLYNIGYGISLASLLLAVTIMIYFSFRRVGVIYPITVGRLHCPRNLIHINLFISFILRCTILFVKENVLVKGVGFPSDVQQLSDGQVEFLDNGNHWGCKLFFTIFNYILGANYIWILTEGLYLHMLITVTVFSEKSGVKWLILFGWGTPVLFVLPWSIVRATVEDVLCWNTHPTPGFFWIIRGPICAAMVVNFIIFLNIIRILFTKLNAFNAPDARNVRYRKLAKSTLVLIPLFGVHYIVFIGLPDNVDETAELVKLYYEMFFNSFQGFFVSLLFCFLNGEVQAEIRKKWRRRQSTRRGSSITRRPTRDTVTSFVSKARGSIISSCNCGDNIVNNNGTIGGEHSPLTNGKGVCPVHSNWTGQNGKIYKGSPEVDSALLVHNHVLRHNESPKNCLLENFQEEKAVEFY